MSNKSDADEFFKYLYWDNDARIKSQRNLERDIEQFNLNKSLRGKEEELIRVNLSARFPIIFIVGVPRSGSTLLTQILINHCDLGYINNYISKFWMAPIYGAIQYQKIKLKTQEELLYESQFGNTKGLNEPSEFGFFWQYWFRHKFHDELSEEELKIIDWKGVNSQIQGLASYFSKPLIFKNLNYTSLKIKYLQKHINNAIFIHIRRKPVFNIQSILQSRKEVYGDVHKWWSLRIKGYNELEVESPYYQVAKQYCHIEQKIRSDLNELELNKRTSINYEDLSSPSKINNLMKFIGHCELKRSLSLPNPKNEISLSENQIKQIHSSIRKISIQ